MINIIMPAYNAHDTIKRAIASVCSQENIADIQLTIVDDHSDIPYDSIVNEFNHLFNINLLRKPVNEGCGQARQYGIDHTTAEYIMFLDADDCLYSFNSVKILADMMEEEKLDVSVSDFIEELENGEFCIHENDYVWMHGKMYRTQFIREKGIRFNYTRCNEDHVFNCLLKALNCKSIHINAVTYAWRYNPTSITRTPGYNYSNGFNDFFINAKYCISEMKRLGVDYNTIKHTCAKYLINMYGYYNIFFAEESAERKQICISKTAQFMSEIPKNIIDELTLDYFSQMLYSDNVIRGILSNNLLFTITLSDFMYLIKDYYAPLQATEIYAATKV